MAAPRGAAKPAQGWRTLADEHLWRDDRAVEGARLESVCVCKRTEGSNPSLSAYESSANQGFALDTPCIIFYFKHLESI